MPLADGFVSEAANTEEAHSGNPDAKTGAETAQAHGNEGKLVEASPHPELERVEAVNLPLAPDEGLASDASGSDKEQEEMLSKSEGILASEALENRPSAAHDVVKPSDAPERCKHDSKEVRALMSHPKACLIEGLLGTLSLRGTRPCILQDYLGIKMLMLA